MEEYTVKLNYKDKESGFWIIGKEITYYSDTDSKDAHESVAQAVKKMYPKGCEIVSVKYV